MKPRFTYLILASIFSILSYTVNAQYTIQGVLTNSNQQPVDGATVVIYDEAHHLIAYTTSDAKGAYYFKESSSAPSHIEVTHIGYAKYQKELPPEVLNGGTAVFDFILSENAKELDDVIIFSYANKEKDTVLLDLQKLKLHEDTNLKEILKKIPNFKLGSNGAIIYKGKSIDKILVNKKESFTQQNSIALESIENRIIEDISVINNYQNDFAIDFDETTESVLNIDTKSEAKQIKTGSILAQYGYQDAYEIKAKALWFGQQLNAFLTHNTNSTGKNTIKSIELQKLFGNQKSISEYQSQSLNGLFSSDENLKKNVFSSTNVTIRNQGERVKSAGVFYYITPSRIALANTTVTTVDDMPLLTNSSSLQSKSTAFLGALSLDYKASAKTIVSYGLHVNVNTDTNANTITNELFAAQDSIPSRFNTITSDHKQHVTSIYNTVSFTSKLSPKLILKTSTGYQLEQGDFLNGFHIRENEQIGIQARQEYGYVHHVYDASATVHYKYNDQFLPSFTVGYQHTEENINDQLEKQILLERDQKEYQLRIGAIGNRILKQFRYQVSVGVDYAENRTDTLSNVYTAFFPYKASLVYENKMNRFSVRTQRSRNVNVLSTGLTQIIPFNQIALGNSIIPQTYTEMQQWTGSYGYTNIFDGKSFAVSVSYTQYTDQLQNYLVQLENGISETAYFLADITQRYTADAYYSATALQVYHPTKIDIGLRYAEAVSPTQVQGREIEVKTQSISPAIGFTTNTEHLINFKLGTQASFTTNITPDTAFDAVYTYTSIAALLKNKHWESKVALVYEHNVINEETYLRKNINLELAYTKGKMKLSMEARHLGEVFDFIDNAAYNSRFSIANGINTLTVNNQSLNYIIFGIQYQL